VAAGRFARTAAGGGRRRPLAPDVGLCAYRVVQEALANVLKHAPGARAEVRLSCAAPGADRLCISEATVKTHLNRTMTKLDLDSRAQAVVAAYESGLVTPGG